VHTVAFLAYIHCLAQRELQPLEVDLAALGADFWEEV